MIFRFLGRTCTRFIPRSFPTKMLNSAMSDKKIIQISKEEYESMKKFMNGELDSLDSIEHAKDFFEEEEQILSFKLMQLSSIEELIPYFKEYEDSSLSAKFLILQKYLYFDGKLQDQHSLPYCQEIYGRIEELQEEELERLMIYIYQHKEQYQQNILPEKVPFLKNPSHQNQNLIIGLEMNYPQHLEAIWKHYQLETGVYRPKVICHLLNKFPNDQKLTQLTTLSLSQAQNLQKIQCLTHFFLRTNLNINFFKQSLTPQFIQECSLSQQLHLLYEIVGCKKPQHLEGVNLVQQIRQNIGEFKQILSSDDFSKIWKIAMIMINYYHPIYMQEKIVDLIEFALNFGIQIDYQEMNIDELFNTIIGYRTAFPLQNSVYQGKNFLRQMQTRAILKTMLRHSRKRIGNEQAPFVCMVATFYGCEESFISPQVLEKLSQKKNDPKLQGYISKILTKWEFN